MAPFSGLIKWSVGISIRSSFPYSDSSVFMPLISSSPVERSSSLFLRLPLIEPKKGLLFWLLFCVISIYLNKILQKQTLFTITSLSLLSLCVVNILSLEKLSSPVKSVLGFWTLAEKSSSFARVSDSCAIVSIASIMQIIFWMFSTKKRVWFLSRTRK